MKILIVEDDDFKYKILIEEITNKFRQFSMCFSRASCVYEYVKIIDSCKFDLIIFDILLPQRLNDEPMDVSSELLDEMRDTKNYHTRSIALTAMLDTDYHTLLRFNEKAIPVVQYKNDELACLDVVHRFIEQAEKVSKVDFLIICALQKEAEAFAAEDVVLGDWKLELGGARYRYAQIGNTKGVVYLLPRMGLISASLVTSKAIEKYHPKVVTMSGICGGVEGECEFVDIIVPELAWDYQVGKATENGFNQEVYQENVDPDIIALLKHEWDKAEFKDYIKNDIKLRSKDAFDPEVRFGPIGSGSAVIADEQILKDIRISQRKLLAVEMEFAAVFSACTYSTSRPLFFGAKSVVDFANKEKSDGVHELGVLISARYIIKMLPKVIELANDR